MTNTINHHSALIYTMVIMSAADGKMSDPELQMIGDIVKRFPVFDGYDSDKLLPISQECAEILSADGGLDAALGLIKQGLPEKLRETAYAAAVEVASADGQLAQEELRLLEHFRDTLELDRLHAGAIERSARARHMTL